MLKSSDFSHPNDARTLGVLILSKIEYCNVPGNLENEVKHQVHINHFNLHFSNYKIASMIKEIIASFLDMNSEFLVILNLTVYFFFRNYNLGNHLIIIFFSHGCCHWSNQMHNKINVQACVALLCYLTSSTPVIPCYQWLFMYSIRHRRFEIWFNLIASTWILCIHFKCSTIHIWNVIQRYLFSYIEKRSLHLYFKGYNFFFTKIRKIPKIISNNTCTDIWFLDVNSHYIVKLKNEWIIPIETLPCLN